MSIIPNFQQNRCSFNEFVGITQFLRLVTRLFPFFWYIVIFENQNEISSIIYSWDSLQILLNVLSFLILIWYCRLVTLNSKIFIVNEVEKYVFHCNRFKYIRFRRDSTSIPLSAFPLRKSLILGNSYSVCASMCVAYLSERCPKLSKNSLNWKIKIYCCCRIDEMRQISFILSQQALNVKWNCWGMRFYL